MNHMAPNMFGASFGGSQTSLSEWPLSSIVSILPPPEFPTHTQTSSELEPLCVDILSSSQFRQLMIYPC